MRSKSIGWDVYGDEVLSKKGDMYGAYVFLYEAPEKHKGDACTQ